MQRNGRETEARKTLVARVSFTYWVIQLLVRNVIYFRPSVGLNKFLSYPAGITKRKSFQIGVLSKMAWEFIVSK